MSDIIQEYKCPCCGGAINFDPNAQKMICPYCDTEFDIEALKIQEEDSLADKADDITWNTQNSNEWDSQESETMKVYSCSSCGGEIVCDGTTAATICPYCDNPIVMNGNLSGTLKPDLIIPFKLDKKSAKEGLINHLKGKKLLPKVFKNENHIEEVKGIYVPFWLFDADVHADVRYKATKTHAWSDSSYNYVETSYFSLFRSGNLGFNMVPVDGSSKMADDLMESVEPFDYSEAVDFRTAYLAGYLADKYDVDADNSVQRANERIKYTTEDVFSATAIGYETVVPQSSSIQTSNGSCKYALLPVWILNTKWKDKTYTFAMNGQNGKFVGNLPMDKGAFWRWWTLFAASFSAVAFAVLSIWFR